MKTTGNVYHLDNVISFHFGCAFTYSRSRFMQSQLLLSPVHYDKSHVPNLQKNTTGYFKNN
jgi:hypothetical protein